MIDHGAFAAALSIVFQFETLAWLCVGSAVGIGVGAMPGLQATTAIALMLPLTFNMPLGASLGLLIGLYKGATYGGSISAITFSTPGTPDSAATVLDGYKLMQAGQGRKAMLMALYASVTADLLSDLLTILLAPMLAVVALKFGPAERFWVMILAITLVGSLSGDRINKGLFSAAIGLFLGTVGTDPIGFVSRNTFGLWWLSDGIPFAPMLIGLFAMSMVFYELCAYSKTKIQQVVASRSDPLTRGSETLSLTEFLSARKEIAIGFGVGSFVGLMPGLGGTAGSFLAYGAARFASPEKNIGSGRLEGVAAAEAGNNATVGPTLVPLLALGIPGSATAALIGGALVLQGVSPSPRMFELFPNVIYALFIILILGNFVNLGFGRLFSTVYARLGAVRPMFLIPAIGMMAVVGTYVFEENPYHVPLMLAFGLLGLFFRLVRIPEAPLVITFLLAPLAEENLRRAILVSGNSVGEALISSPLSIGIAIASGLSILLARKIRVNEKLTTLQRSHNSDSDRTLALSEIPKAVRRSGVSFKPITITACVIAVSSSVVLWLNTNETGLADNAVNLPTFMQHSSETSASRPVAFELASTEDQSLPADNKPVQVIAPPEIFSDTTSLLALAATDIEALRLTTPENANAWSKLQAVLIIDPDNVEAQKQLHRIFSIYVSLAKAASRDGRPDRAKIYLDRADIVLFRSIQP